MIPVEIRRLHERGRSLIPIGADKKALVPWKQFQSERADLHQIQAWQADLQPPIWAVVTGEVSGLIALDFDVPDGPKTLADLGLPVHRSTPSGGAHVDVVHPGWKVPTVSSKTKKELAKAYPGLDIRGDGGYINVLGQTANGSYEWLTDLPPLSVEQLPGELRVALSLDGPPVPAAPRAAVPKPRVPTEQAVPVGAAPPAGNRLIEIALRRASRDGRNNAGFWLACQLRDEGLTIDQAEVAMLDFADLVPLFNGKGQLEPYEVEETLASLNQAFRQEPREKRTHSEILVSDRQLRDLSNEAVATLVTYNQPPRIFLYGGVLTRLVRDDHGHMRAEALRPDGIRHLLSHIADWIRIDQYGTVRNVLPPMAVARDWLAREWDEIPRLTGILTAPCLRDDGSLLDQPGYDPATGLWLDPDGLTIPSIPEHPTDEQVASALQLLVNDLLGDFCFVDEASKANALALLLTAVLRPAIGGLVPLALVDAPVAGTGKTFLVDIAALVATGQRARLTAAPGRDDEELRKRLTSIFIAGESMIVFDNISTTLSSSVLAQALTAPAWSDRILGVST